MKNNIWTAIRERAAEVADQFAASMNAEVDAEGAHFIPLPGAWRGLWIFRTVNVSGETKEMSVMQEPLVSGLGIRFMSPGVIRYLSLDAFRDRIQDLMGQRQKSQGQVVSEAVYENAHKPGGLLYGNIAKGPWKGEPRWSGEQGEHFGGAR